MFEPSEVARYRRQLDGMLTAAGRDDPEALAAVAELLSEAYSVGLLDAANALHDQTGIAGGYSWSDIGRALGMTRQSAFGRFARKASR